MFINSSATFDVLYIANSTKCSYHDLSFYEFNFLLYFACLMSLYDGNPTSEWEYTFYKNANGVPVSSAVAEALNALAANGELKEMSRYYAIMPDGEANLEFYKCLSTFRKRTKYLDAACDCLLTDSIVSLSTAISFDPVIKESIVHNRKTLNSDDNESLVSLYAQFETIQRVVGMQKELFVPAYMWIQYLKIQNDDFGRTDC